ncbi:MAG: alpha/beta hydrolase [Blastochloris sp.]|nr:alpha/beta hydrolase [Blastochloris sp.]
MIYPIEGEVYVNRASGRGGKTFFWRADRPLTEANRASVRWTVEDLSAGMPAGWSEMTLYDINQRGQAIGFARVNGIYRGVMVTLSQRLIAVDRNRDGDLSFSDSEDETRPDKPFTFWLNDDQDEAAFQTVDQLTEEDDVKPKPSSLDYKDTVVKCNRDLEDFLRIHLKAPAGFDPASRQWQMRLIFAEIKSGKPRVRIWQAREEGLGYLESESAATSQREYMNSEYPLGMIHSDGEKPILPTRAKRIFQRAEDGSWRANLLMEGAGEGEGALTVRFYREGGLVAESKFYLRLLPMEKLYDHWTVGDTDDIPWQDIPSEATRIGSAEIQAEEPGYIIFVHGWRLKPWERRAFAETAYKRLWHQGYKGGYGIYSWPTEYSNNPAIPPQNFNRSDRKALLSASGLLGVLEELNQQKPKQVRLFAHSMGNVVVSEALRLGKLKAWAEGREVKPLLHTYVTSQAAVSSHSYDPSRTTLQEISDKNIPNVLFCLLEGGQRCYVS